MKQMLKVLFLAAEADPFVKIGGLGDVAGSLPAALRALTPNFPLSGDGEHKDRERLEVEVDVRLVIPFHGVIQRQAFTLHSVGTFSIAHTSGLMRAEIFSTEYNGVPVYLIAGPLFPPGDKVYTSDPSIDGIKYTFFSLAALELARLLNWPPDVLHANDWQTAPALYALRRNRDADAFYYNTAALLGVHNLPYLGVGAGPALASFGLPPAVNSPLPKWAQHLPLPLGLLSADHIVTVSPGYAAEILTPEFGSGLHEFLQSRASSISGILNGIDTQRWDPGLDPALVKNFSREDLASREANKLALQREFELEVNPRLPLLAMITRMDYQKGVDLALEALEQIGDRPWQAIILGTGDPTLEASAIVLETSFPDRARAAIRFDPALSRRIYAGADALLIPSRYEPCGLAQMIAMRYGCVPVARAVGGLRDTILDYNLDRESTGFLFAEPSADALARTLVRALQVYSSDPAEWSRLQQAGMAADFSWERFAGQYLSLYLSLAAKLKSPESSRSGSQSEAALRSQGSAFNLSE